MPKQLRDIVSKFKPDKRLEGENKSTEMEGLPKEDDRYIGSDDKGGKKFVAKHKISVKDYPSQSKDDVPFKANKRFFDTAQSERHGYDGGKKEDEKVYEAKMTSADKAKEDRLKDKYEDGDDSMKEKFIQEYMAKGKTKEEAMKMYYAYVRKQAMKKKA